MSPKFIHRVLDLSVNARSKGLNLNPLFIGEAGIGKSFVVQQWVAEQRKRDPNFGFMDLRIAYLEAPDFVGYPDQVVDKSGRKRLDYSLPIYWPTEGSGLLLLEEPNRGNPSVMNCLMQLLTDRKVHDYNLPEGWIIAGAVNPESSNYDVNTMDTALMNRFEHFNVDYNVKDFVEYMQKSEFDSDIINFVKDGTWQYTKPSELAATAKYISPRTIKKMSDAEKAGAGLNQEDHFEFCTAILGSEVGHMYHSFKFDHRPVTAKEIMENSEAAIKRLKRQLEKTDKKDYRGDLVNVTVTSIIENIETFPKKLAIEVGRIIAADQFTEILRAYVKTNKEDNEYNIDKIINEYPEIKDILKTGLKRSKMQDVKDDGKK